MSVAASIIASGKVPLVTGETLTFGNGTTPITLTLTTGLAIKINTTLATMTTAILWEAGATGEPLGSFELLVVQSSQDLMIEFTTDQNGGVGDEVYTMKIKAGIPFILSSNVSYANYTANFGGGTLDVIDRIRIRNLTGSTANITGVICR